MECGNNKFWFFWNFVRCPKCLNEYKTTETVTMTDRSQRIPVNYNVPENWLRRFNNETHQYSNWEKTK
jgi:hypothetical protein